MLHHIGGVSAFYADPALRHVAAVTLALVLGVVIKRTEDICYVEFSDAEPMVNVIAAIRDAERDHSVAFDPEDSELWEQVPGGYRLHGMFIEELT